MYLLPLSVRQNNYIIGSKGLKLFRNGLRLIDKDLILIFYNSTIPCLTAAREKLLVISKFGLILFIFSGV